MTAVLLGANPRDWKFWSFGRHAWFASSSQARLNQFYNIIHNFHNKFNVFLTNFFPVLC